MNYKDYLTHFKTVVDAQVEGWFYPIDIIMLSGLLNDIQKFPGDICEIGVAYGKSAICLSQFRSLSDKLYLYDIFDDDIKEKALDNIKRFGNPNHIEVRVQNTMTLTHDDLSFDRPLRLLHIDGCHEHSAVLNDLQLFTEKMSDGGVIVLDDYNDYEYPGVNSAASEYMLSKYNRNNWRIFAIGDNKAYMCQKKHLTQYQNAMVDYFVKAVKKMYVPFPLPMGVREMHDVNVLLCDSRNGIDVEQIKEKLTQKPEIN